MRLDAHHHVWDHSVPDALWATPFPVLAATAETLTSGLSVAECELVFGGTALTW